MLARLQSSWTRMLGVLGLALIAATLLWCQPSQGQPAGAKGAPKDEAPAVKDRRLQAFMRKKLAASTMVLEGLCTEDLQLVAEGAKRLHEMSDAEAWHVSNDVMYKQFSNEFRQITKELIKAAEEDKADRATLKWLDATVSCLDCHRFVRGMRIVEQP